MPHDWSNETNNATWRSKQQKRLKTSPLAGGVVFASIYVKYSMKVEGGFPCLYLSIFLCNFLKTTKRQAKFTHLLYLMQIIGALQAKKQNSKVKSKDKILNSSPVSIFFDKINPFLPVLLAIELYESNLQESLCNNRNMLNTSHLTYRLSLCLRVV